MAGAATAAGVSSCGAAGSAFAGTPAPTRAGAGSEAGVTTGAGAGSGTGATTRAGAGSRTGAATGAGAGSRTGATTGAGAGSAARGTSVAVAGASATTGSTGAASGCSTADGGATGSAAWGSGACGCSATGCCGFLRNQLNRPFFSPASAGAFLSSLEPNMEDGYLRVAMGQLWRIGNSLYAEQTILKPAGSCATFCLSVLRARTATGMVARQPDQYPSTSWPADAKPAGRRTG